MGVVSTPVWGNWDCYASDLVSQSSRRQPHLLVQTVLVSRIV